MTATRQTTLSVVFDTGDGTESYVYEVADTDVTTFAFDAGEAITEDTHAVLQRLDRMDDDVSDLIVNETVETPLFRVTLSGLTRGATYELSLVMVNGAGRHWTRTLTVACVA